MFRIKMVLSDSHALHLVMFVAYATMSGMLLYDICCSHMFDLALCIAGQCVIAFGLARCWWIIGLNAMGWEDLASTEWTRLDVDAALFAQHEQLTLTLSKTSSRVFWIEVKKSQVFVVANSNEEDTILTERGHNAKDRLYFWNHGSYCQIAGHLVFAPFIAPTTSTPNANPGG